MTSRERRKRNEQARKRKRAEARPPKNYRLDLADQLLAEPEPKLGLLERLSPSRDYRRRRRTRVNSRRLTIAAAPGMIEDEAMKAELERAKRHARRAFRGIVTPATRKGLVDPSNLPGRE